MSAAIPSIVGTPQPSGMQNASSQAFAQAQLQQQQLQAQNMFRQKQLMAQKQQQQMQQQMFQHPQMTLQQQQHQQQFLQQQKQQQMQQHLVQQQLLQQQQMQQQQQQQQQLLQQQHQQQQQQQHTQLQHTQLQHTQSQHTQLQHTQLQHTQLQHTQQLQQQSQPLPQPLPQQQQAMNQQPQQPQQSQQQATPRLNVAHPSTPIMTTQQQGSPAPSKVITAPRSQSSGQAVLRLLQFAEQLSPGQEKAVDRSYWDSFIDDFFTNQSTMKMGLYNIETKEQKSYEVNQAPQARYFHTQYLCGVISIQMTLEKTMEYILPGGIMNVECPRASFIYRFGNGSMVISLGHLWVQFVMTVEGIWKIGHFDYISKGHKEYINRSDIKESPVQTTKKKIPQPSPIIPDSLINKWGVPPRVFHILQMADIAPRMSEIVFHSLVSGSTPRESLNAIAFDKQPGSLKNENEVATIPQPMIDSSPIVKTQTSAARPHPPPTLQQQATLRQQQAAALAAGFSFPQGPQTPMGYIPHQLQQQAYLTTIHNNNNTNHNIQQQQQQSPTVSRKRGSAATSSDVKSSPVARKKNNNVSSTPRKQ